MNRSIDAVRCSWMRALPSVAIISLLLVQSGHGFAQTNANPAAPAADKQPVGEKQPVAQGVKPASFDAPVGDPNAPAAGGGYGDAATKRPQSTKPLLTLAPSKTSPTKPHVELSEAHRAISRKRVGDAFPAMALKNLAGAETSLSNWHGKRLTLVVFWSHEHVYATEQFSHLAGEVVAPFRQTGLSVVAIHVGEGTEKVKALRTNYPGEFACLLDPEGESFAKVAETKLPRTYLLDSKGTIVWLDLEYSRSMRRQLDNAIRYHLQGTTAK